MRKAVEVAESPSVLRSSYVESGRPACLPSLTYLSWREPSETSDGQARYPGRSCRALLATGRQPDLKETFRPGERKDNRGSDTGTGLDVSGVPAVNGSRILASLGSSSWSHAVFAQAVELAMEPTPRPGAGAHERCRLTGARLPGAPDAVRCARRVRSVRGSRR